MPSALSKIVTARPSGGGNNIRDGRYKYLIEKCLYDPKAFNGELFVAELRVIEAQYNGDVDEKNQPTTPNAVGSTVSMTCLLDKFENAAGNVKAFLLGALAPLGYVEDQITEQLILDCCAAGNPLRGIVIGNETRRGFNKGRRNPSNTGKPLTLNSWKPISQTAEDIKAQRAWLDANGARPDVAPATPSAPIQPAAQTIPVAQTVAAATVAAVAPAAPAVAPTPLQPSPASSGLLASLGLGK